MTSLTEKQKTHLNNYLDKKENLLGNPEKSFLSISELTKENFSDILLRAHDIKQDPKKYSQSLAGKKIALLFQKTSTRTKESFMTGCYELGMFSSFINWRDSNFTLASLEDEIKVLSQWYDCIMARVNDHSDLLTMKKYSEVPIINGLCDLYHPCQALADLQTIQESFGDNLGSLHIAYVGDGNNVCNSLIESAALAGVGKIVVATPDDINYKPLPISEKFALEHTDYAWTSSIEEAVRGAHVVYTDTWVSMGQEKETEKRLSIFSEYQVNSSIMALASPDHIFMHDLPAHIGKEVTSTVLRSHQSVVFEQAQNRKHAQKSLLLSILGIGH